MYKTIPNFPEFKINESGNIISTKNGSQVKCYDSGGYLGCNCWRNPKNLRPRIHRLVALAFIPNPDNLPYVDHIDGNTRNNNVSNLRWCTAHQNILNTKTYSTNKSGHKGVYFFKEERGLKHWVAKWIENGKAKKKRFISKEEAIDFRNQMVQIHYDKDFYRE
jgi:hypothetical protein